METEQIVKKKRGRPKKEDKKAEGISPSPSTTSHQKTQSNIESIDDLPGVGPAVSEKLRECGYDTVLSIAVTTPKNLSGQVGLTEASARKIILAARESLDMGFDTADVVEIRRTAITKLKTGSDTFDNILGGGFESGTISELFGAYGSGKTQIAHSLCVRIQLEDPEAKAIYIDSESCFRPERIRHFAQALGLDPDKVLKNIYVAKARNSDHQIFLAEKSEEKLKTEKIRLIVVDSLTAHLRAEFCGRGTLADRQQRLNGHMHTLMKLADMYNVPVLVTNQIQYDPSVMFGNPEKPIGGAIIAHNSSTRIHLRRGKADTRVAKLIDSPSLPDSEASFQITEGGLVDV